MTTATTEKLAIKAFLIATPAPERKMAAEGKRQRPRRKASYQPVFPDQYPKECKSCRTPGICEKFVTGSRERGARIFVCPKNTWRPKPANTQKGLQK